MDLLVFDEVAASHGQGPAVFAGLNLMVRSSEVVALTGRSGSGKSTALAVAMGLHAPSVGKVSWKGDDLYLQNEEARADLRRGSFGIVLQDGGLLHGLTALENVIVPVLGRRPSKDERDRARSALEVVGMKDRADHDPSELSGGQIQRVAFARALFAEPEILVIDEPTASLDRRSADNIIDLMMEVARDGRGVLVASHDPEVGEIATRRYEIEELQRPEPRHSGTHR